MLARAALAVTALIIAFWMAVLVHDSINFDRATAPPSGGLGGLGPSLRHGGLAKRADLLRSSTLLSAGTAAELQLAGFYEIRSQPGDLQRALAIAESVARREPSNLDAWIHILSNERALHRAQGADAAIQQILRLDPRAKRS